MLCLKEKCDYCVEHDFRISYYVCLLSSDSLSFKKTSNIKCIVDKRIEEIENELAKLISIKEKLIERSQK